jgi:hypothetical protein
LGFKDGLLHVEVASIPLLPVGFYTNNLWPDGLWGTEHFGGSNFPNALSLGAFVVVLGGLAALLCKYFHFLN